jgi:hypothetical protein
VNAGSETIQVATPPSRDADQTCTEKKERRTFGHSIRRFRVMKSSIATTSNVGLCHLSQRSQSVWISAARASDIGRSVDFGALIFPILLTLLASDSKVVGITIAVGKGLHVAWRRAAAAPSASS